MKTLLLLLGLSACLTVWAEDPPENLPGLTYKIVKERLEADGFKVTWLENKDVGGGIGYGDKKTDQSELAVEFTCNRVGEIRSLSGSYTWNGDIGARLTHVPFLIWIAQMPASVDKDAAKKWVETKVGSDDHCLMSGLKYVLRTYGNGRSKSIFVGLQYP